MLKAIFIYLLDFFLINVICIMYIYILVTWRSKGMSQSKLGDDRENTF